MANNKRETNRATFLSSILAAGGVSGAGAYAYSHFGRSVATPRGSLGRMGPGFKAPIIEPTSTVDPRASFIEDLVKTPEGAEIAKIAWKQSVESIDPRSSEILSFAGDIDTLPSDQLAMAIKETLKKNTSSYMDKVFIRFRQSVRAMGGNDPIPKAPPKLNTIAGVQLPAGRDTPIKALPPELRRATRRIQKVLGNNFADIKFHTRHGWEKEGFGVYEFNMAFKGNRFSFNVPASVGGALVEGSSQSTRRIALSAAILDPKTMTPTETLSRSEFFMRHIETSVLPRVVSGELKSSFDINRAISSIYQTDIRSLESIPNIPGSVAGRAGGLMKYQTLRGKAVDVMIPTPEGGFRGPNESELAQVMKNTGLLPATSPSGIAEGRLSGMDPRRWSMTPSAVDFSRSPAQAVREWKATPEAVRAMMDRGRVKYSVFNTPGYREDFGSTGSPHLRTLYIDPSRRRGRELIEELNMGEGTSLLSNNPALLRELEVSRIAPNVHLSKVHPDMADVIAGKKKFSPGDFLGFTSEGLPFNYRSEMNFLSMVEHNTSTRGEYADLTFEERMLPPEHSKVFGDLKAVRRQAKEHEVRKAVRRRTKNTEFLKNIEQWVNMDELRKDTSKHNKQMITAMWDVMDRNRTFLMSKRAQSFMRNPRATAALFEQRANVGGTYHHEAFVKQMMSFGLQEGNLSPEEFGAVFGAVPSVLKKDQIRNIYKDLGTEKMSFRHLRRMYDPFSFGVARGEFAGHDYAGTLGSIEPRIFDLLRSGQYGGLGADISDELMRRAISSNPEKMGAYKQLTRTLQSLIGDVRPGKESIWDIGKKDYSYSGFQNWVEQGGGFIRPGSGLRDIYVPGAKDIDAMMTYKTSGEDLVTSDVGQLYHGIARDLQGMKGDVDTMTTEGALSRIAQFAQDIQEQQAPAGRGAGSILRAKGLVGSRFLTGVSEAGGQMSNDIRTAVIGMGQAQRMLEEIGVTGELTNNQVIPGLVARHPFIGPYSMQPINYRVSSAIKDDVIVMPSTSASVRLGGETTNLQISPLVGMAGDLDADKFAAYMVSPDLQKKLRAGFTGVDNEFTQTYMQHTIRMQLMKAKARASGVPLTNINKLIADAQKLGTAQNWVGQLSVQLGGARQAVTQSLKGQQAANAMFLLEWLEQTPISGKHLDPSKVLSGEMSTLLSQIQSSLQHRSPQRMMDVVNTILDVGPGDKQSDTVAKRLLIQDLNIEQGIDSIRRISGINVDQHIKGIDLQNTVSNIMGALDAADQSGISKMARMAQGRASVSMGNMKDYLSFVGQNSSPGVLSTAKMVATNTAAALTGHLGPHKKAIGFGFIGALAIGAALSKPDAQIGPGANLVGDVTMQSPSKAARRMTPDSVHPPSQPLGNPSGPSRIYTPRAMIQPGGDSMRMSVVMRSDGRINSGAMARKIQQHSGNSNVSVNVRDNTTRMNPHLLANRLF